MLLVPPITSAVRRSILKTSAVILKLLSQTLSQMELRK